MTTYYQKAFEVLDEKIYTTNPAPMAGLLSTLSYGGVLKVKSPYKDESVHYKVQTDVPNAKFTKEPEYADGDYQIHDGITRPAWATWSVKVNELDMMDIQANPQGETAQAVQNHIIAQQGHYMHMADRFVANYLATANPTTAIDEHIADWTGAFSSQGATGTVFTPEDCNSTAGTITATGVKIMGAGGVVDSVAKGFDVIKKRFHSFRDTTTQQSLLKEGGNVFTLYGNPEAIAQITDANLSNASGEIDYSQNIGQILGSRYRIVPTLAFDAAYDMAAATVSEWGMAVNTEENFMWKEVVPYGVSEWTYTANPDKPKAGVFRKWGGMRFIAFPKPYYINSAWKKGFQHFSNIPYATS